MVNCHRCGTYHPHMNALREHERNSSRHHQCSPCNADFTTWTGLKEHFVQSPQHDYCQRCDEHFDDHQDLMQHYHAQHIYCQPCNDFFQNEYGLQEHYRQSAAHHYCVDCKRDFQSSSNLNAHLNSSIHRPKDVLCPFQGCDSRGFVSRSALVLHLESGNCRSGINRRAVDRFVREQDRGNLITDPARMLTNGNSNDEITYTASDAAWNGSAYECYLCHRQHRSLNALNQHLASPRHQQKMYMCPLHTCGERFTTLSGLCQHVESEKCGVSRFSNVQHALAGMDCALGQMRRLTY